MSIADLVIAAVVLLSVLIGLARGFVVEVVSLLVWIGAFVLAMILGPALAAAMVDVVALPSARLLLGYIVVFVVALAIGALLVWFMRKLVAGTGLSGTDRMLGMLFGLTRGAVVVTVAVLLLGFTPFPRDPWWRESRALPAFEAMAEQAARWLPEAMRRHLDYARGELPAPPTDERAPVPAAGAAEPVP